jgi:hypothetical protein
VIALAKNWNVLVVSVEFWIVKVVSVASVVGKVFVVVRPVDVPLTTTNLFALDVNVGSLSKPAVTRSSSARMDAEVAADPVDGNDPWE